MDRIRRLWHRLTGKGYYAWAREQHEDAMYFEDATVEAVVLFEEILATQRKGAGRLPPKHNMAIREYLVKYNWDDDETTGTDSRNSQGGK